MNDLQKSKSVEKEVCSTTNARYCMDSQNSMPSQRIYFGLLENPEHSEILNGSLNYLNEKIAEADDIESDLPMDPKLVSEWIKDSAENVGHQFRSYLKGRRSGEPRKYFSNRAHALYFLKYVAPTKLVDGAWLYGLVHKWKDDRFLPLLQTYLEELGDGVPTKNHVLIYKKLLRSNGCEAWEEISDHHFVQGAIQLCLAYNADRFLPEVIGFNLGYEQLPLHLPITSYELTELGINPYYFKLHLTVDNASTGHAKKSLAGLLDTLPLVDDAKEFFRRVQRGYKLNMLGASTNSVIASFDIEQELISLLAAKGMDGKLLHADYCRIENRTVTDWLSAPGNVAMFLDALQRNGWIKRNQDPRESRFWKLIEGDSAKMFGVFSSYEQEIIYHWIANNYEGAYSNQRGAFSITDSVNKDIGSAMRKFIGPHAEEIYSSNSESIDRDHASVENVLQESARLHEEADDFNGDLHMLKKRLVAAKDKSDAVGILKPLISPSYHHTPVGLMATRIFSEVVRA